MLKEVFYASHAHIQCARSQFYVCFLAHHTLSGHVPMGIADACWRSTYCRGAHAVFMHAWVASVQLFLGCGHGFPECHFCLIPIPQMVFLCPKKLQLVPLCPFAVSLDAFAVCGASSMAVFVFLSFLLYLSFLGACHGMDKILEITN